MIYIGECHDNIQIVAEQWANKLYDFMFKERKKKLRIKGLPSSCGEDERKRPWSYRRHH